MTDIALHWIYRACLTADEDLLKTAIDYSYSTVKYTTAEGFSMIIAIFSTVCNCISVDMVTRY